MFSKRMVLGKEVAVNILTVLVVWKEKLYSASDYVCILAVKGLKYAFSKKM